MTLAARARFGISTPQIFVGEPVDPHAIARFARRAEAAGYDGLWTQDQVIGPAVTLEPLGVLTYAAAHTERVRLGVSVLVFPRRNPVVLAKMAATIDQLSRGRLVLGIGLGHNVPQDVAFEIGEGDRLRRFTEGLAIMRSLWSEDATAHAGKVWSFEDAPMAPKPVQQPHLPVWFGVGHPKALNRAARLADGWMGAGSSTIEQFAANVVLLRDLLEEAGRDVASFPIAKRLYLAVDDDERRAKRRLDEWFTTYYGEERGTPMADRVAVWGPAAHVAERIAAVVDAGAGTVLLNPVYDHERHLEVLAETVGLDAR